MIMRLFFISINIKKAGLMQPGYQYFRFDIVYFYALLIQCLFKISRIYLS